MNRVQYGMFIVALLIALVLSAFNTTPAFANEAIPPADETITQEIAPSEEVVNEIEATTNQEDEATPPDVSEVDSVSDEESTTVAEVIESLPEDTEIIVLDENGEALPLATAEAEDAVYNGDPLWCPAGVAPNPGVGGCSPSFTGFTDDAPLTDNGLIAWLYDPLNATTVSKAGVIWVAYDYGTTEVGDIIIDGTQVAGTMETFALTIQGGWNGTNGSKLLDTTTPYSEINNLFIISNWNNAVTVNNLFVTGVSAPSNSALEVYTTGNITVNNVDVVNNTAVYGGAYLNNSGGTGNVTVNDSTFNNNAGTGTYVVGLDISTAGTVTLKNVTTNANSSSNDTGGIGTNISNTNGTTPKAVNINGTNQFNYNEVNGLIVNSKGVITINNVTAMNNTDGHGVLLDNCSYNAGICDYGVSSGVSVKGTNNFSNNGYDGLRVISGGVITVNNITANGNGTSASRPAVTLTYDAPIDATGKGVFLLNIGATTPKNITISGTNTFNFNASNGLSVFTDGMITVNNITANFNECDPTKDTDPTWCAGAVLLGNSGVTQTGYGRFELNNDHAQQNGLFVMINSGKGAVTLNNLFAFANGDIGVEIAAGGGTPATAINVTINGANTFLNNGDSGLTINTDGTVTLNNLTAESNGNYGVFVSNIGLTKAVTLKGINTFNTNTNTGLYIQSYGAITTNAVTAFANSTGEGVYLDNCVDNGGTCDALTVQPITMNGNNLIESNGGVIYPGLNIKSRGAITINNLSTNQNGDDGAFITNDYTNSVGGVTIKGYATANNNGDMGLNINSYGAISLINVTANFNGAHGAYLDNADTTTPKTVTIAGINHFNGNSNSGLLIRSFGAITTNALTVTSNTDNGISFNNCIIVGSNCTSPSAQPITLNGNNFFEANGDGSFIISRGAVTVNNLTANYNGLTGLSINNTSDNAVGGVTIKGYATALANNALFGIFIDSNGAVTLANVTSSYTSSGSSYGLFISNTANTATPANVTITGTNIFNNNAAKGLFIATYGVVTLNNLTANSNGSGGVQVINNTGTLAKSVTLNGNNTFSFNSGTGLNINSLGAIKINNIVASYNGGASSSGAELINNGAIENQPITITGFGVFNNNGYFGLNAVSNGNVTLTNIDANYNVDTGTNIGTENNATPTSFANVTITGFNTFNNNIGGNGLRIYADGNIAVSNITANNNALIGAYLNNDDYANSGASGIRTVTVSGVNMFNENDFGLSIYSNGTVSLTRITANLNSDGTGDGVGLYVLTDGAINLTCGSMNGNTDYGYDLIAGVGKVVTIKGVFSYNNSLGDVALPTAVVTRACPLP